MQNGVHDFFGVGIEWTENLEDEVIENAGSLECFELIPDNFFFNRRRGFLKKLRDKNIPTMIHGVELSIGSAESVKQAHLDRMKEIAELVNTINISDHLCMTEAGSVEIGQLTPLPWTMETCDVFSKKIEAIQSQFQVPFLIENVANRFIFPDNELSETEFINTILRRTGCYFLLDLHNLYANATNFEFDPWEWLEQIDFRFVTGIHLAGGFLDDEGMYVDGHNNYTPDKVWDFYKYVCERVRPSCTIVEWTEEPPAFKELMRDVKKAQKILASHKPKTVRQDLRQNNQQGVAL